MSETPSASAPNRWGQLIVGIICMTMIANLQYGWTYFVDPMDQQNHWGKAAISLAFTTFVATETWLVPIEGWFVDRYGPRIVVAVGGIIVAIGWSLNSIADSLWLLYVAAAVTGVGAGAVYGTSVGNALKWFPDRRGLCAGLTAAGFGAGAALTVVPIIDTIQATGYQNAFLYFGLGQGAVVLVLSQLLRAPLPGQAPKAAVKLRQSNRNYTWLDMLKTPTFWVLYVMFVLVAAPGLIVTANIAPIAKDFKVDALPISFLFISGTVLKTAGVVDNILNGLARPTFGWVSDRLGREPTMALVFTLGACSYWALGTLGEQPAAFVISAGLVFFTWGEIYSLFPATCTDVYGPKYATTNSGLLYTAKGMGSLLVPVAVNLKGWTGSWHGVFVVLAITNLVVAATALFILKPLREREMARAEPLGAATSAAE
ncbi:MAG TPA: oxalate/formate MFS antiporter [Stellaceae bacterium]|nr:oxalate/formate MFS antiporter [Stellaceae bacterium]